MGLNLNNKTKYSQGETMHSDLDNKTKDEILDYLVGGCKNNPNRRDRHSFDTLRERLNRTCNKINTDASLVETLLNFFKKFFEGCFHLSLALVYFTIDLFTRLNELRVNLPAKLGNKEFDLSNHKLQEFSKNNFKSLKDTLKQLDSVVEDLYTTTVDFLEKAKDVLSTYIQKMDNPSGNRLLFNTKKFVVGTVLLIGCSLLSLIGQAAIQNTNHKEDILSTRRLASVNWNINGSVTELERENIRKLMRTGNIKLLPTAKTNSTDIKFVTENLLTKNKPATPDTYFMLIASNSIEHEVNSNESILAISKRYKVSISDLISANPNSDLINLKEGTKLAIPNNTEISNSKPSEVYSKIPRNLIASRSISRESRGLESNYDNSGRMMWPVPASQTVSSHYGYRGGGFHPGVDITAPTGTPIVATKDGVVVSSGWSGGYGKCVVIDHGNGVMTRYGHASSLLVGSGQVVKAGQSIARVGSTGWSTGPHLHYEVLISGQHNNPSKYF